MSDWLVYLSPLALLPIVLLFGFVGCRLNTKGTPLPLVALVIGKGMESGIASVLVEFQFRLHSGEAASNRYISFTIASADLVEGAVFDKTDELDLMGGPNGILECTCSVTETGSSTPIPLFYNQSYDSEDEDKGLDAFKISRENGEYSLVTTWIDYV